jgi:glutamate/tyrosine decarboxylase-like PLP-dependent enzyme
VQPEGHGLQQKGKGPRSVLVEHHPPQKLQPLLDVSLPDEGRGKDGLLEAVQRVLQYSVNTWDQGFLDKLYAATTPVGLAADLLLSALNSNLHVYQVSPALTIIEKATTRKMAELYGFKGTYAGGVSQPGGSAANLSSIIIARNNLFPETKTEGYGGKKFVLFTSAHGHYSLEKAAQIVGFGSNAVIPIAVDEQGRMQPAALDAAIEKAKKEGKTPFYVNATAGTTVLGSFDPLPAIADICQKHNLWLHVDGSWGGPVIFSAKHKHKLAGVERANTIALCPHKMMGVPLTCTFLLGQDIRQFHKGMTLPAGYLFHQPEGDAGDPSAVDSSAPAAGLEQPQQEFWDLADITPQCGRRGDSLKVALSWIYHGHAGFESYIDSAFEQAANLAELVEQGSEFSLVSTNPPPCLQVCFYYNKQSGEGRQEKNSKMTAEVSKKLIPRGFMVDYAPGEDGKFFRVVVNGQTKRGTVEGLVKAIAEVGHGVVV